MSSNLKVYWWKGKNDTPNFGDELTVPILETLFDVRVRHSDIDNANLLGAGSIFDKLYRSKSLYNRKRDLFVVGSGLIEPKIKPKPWSKRWGNSRKLPGCVRVCSARGYLTQQLLLGSGEESCPVGDPGLLLPQVCSPSTSKKYKYGIIPHFSSFKNVTWQELAKKLDGRLIDFRTRNYHSLIEEMLSCEIIVSQGLHGLILSDAYSIPNAWIYDGPLHAGGVFKFYDYFSSVGRPFQLYLSKNDLGCEDVVNDNIYTSRQKVISKLQKSIQDSFQEALSSL